MAVLIASSLRKELSGDPLFDNVSFKVERGDRLALAGPNGAGKTTLLRALIGETELAGGELAWERRRVAATSGRRRRRFSLRVRAVGAADLAEMSASCAASGRWPPAIRGDVAALRRGPGAPQHGAATAGVTTPAPSRGLGFADETRPGLETSRAAS
jgi:energy-coupling factor transporter ATP-binding protein EcfA2